MDAEYTRLMQTPRRARILETQSVLLSNFVAEHKLAVPQWAFYRPLEWCEQGVCFINVEKQVQKMSGSALVGWMFWEVENLIAYTEAHSIWVTPQGTWIDITPHSLPPKRVMFSPDPRVAEKRGYTIPFETPLTANPKELALHRFSRSLSEIWNRHFVGFNKEIDIPMNEVKDAAKAAGLPEDVAKHLFEKRGRWSSGL